MNNKIIEVKFLSPCCFSLVRRALRTAPNEVGVVIVYGDLQLRGATSISVAFRSSTRALLVSVLNLILIFLLLLVLFGVLFNLSVLFV